jgi:hypothetical protein
MQVNGIKTYIVETDNTETDFTSPVSDPKANSVDSTLEDAFGDFGTEGTSSSNPMDEYIITDPTAAPTDSAAALLSDFPPSLEELVAANEQVFRYLDVVKQRYETTKQDLITLRDNYLAALPYVSAGEAQILRDKIELVNAAIMKCDQEIAKCRNKKDYLETNVWPLEQSSGLDLDGDGYIGKAGDPGTLGVIYDEDGVAHYIDPATGNVVRNPMLDPEYEAQITSNDAFTMIDAADAIGNPLENPEDVTQADIYLKLNDISKKSGDYNAFDFGIPEYIWVEREDGSYEPAYDYESEDHTYKFDANLWTCDENGLRQRVPEDRSGYVQVRVHEVKVYSEKVMTGDDGVDLYNTYIEFLDADGVKIARIRLEGDFMSGPAAAVTSMGEYVAASTLGISFNSDRRASPVIFDASRYVSTGRHIIDNLASKLGVTEPDNTRGAAAFNENINAFSGDSFDTEYFVANEGSWGGGTWNTVSHSWDYSGGYDAYVPDLPGENDTLQAFQTGIIFEGRGTITGSQYNDIFIVPDVNELSDYAKEHMPPNAEPYRSGDALYSTVIYGGGGNNIVKGGKGDLFARDISFAWVDASHNDTVAISVIEESVINDNHTETTDGTHTDSKRDPKNFVRIEGAGHSILWDFGEQQESYNAGYVEGLHNDFYCLSGQINVGVVGDPDVVGYERLGTANQAEDANGRNMAFEDRKAAIEEALVGYGLEDEEFDAPTKWLEDYGYSAEQDAEMDEFFSSMFSDLSEFQVEMLEE